MVFGKSARPLTIYDTGIWLSILLLLSCQSKEGSLFELLSPEESGVTFANTLIEDEAYNLYDYEYMYNGGGVGIIDVNNDSLPDLFFGGNTVSSQLYLNRGDMTFQHITASAGVETDRWVAGVAVVDINQDGWQDLYLAVAGNRRVSSTANLLFINNRDNTFTEAAQQWGIADTSLTTQAAFFDYDVDGDLDLYLLNFGNIKWAKEQLYPKITNGTGPGADKLYRNDRTVTGPSHPFTEVTAEAGIGVEGYGLGISVVDVNRDHYPDLYVANDYLDDDALYINNQRGGFEDQLNQYLKHTSYFAMGCDAADINNDGRSDLLVLDMLPEENERHKVLIGSSGYEKVRLRLEQGYQPAYVRNMLHLNQGSGFFSEIGRLSGIEATDWSWAPLLADFDNDGYRDLYVTNGYKKEVSNMDILLTVNLGSLTGDEIPDEEVFRDKQREKFLEAVSQLPENRLVNYAYSNRGDLTFDRANDRWGIDHPSFSNGAAYADLDNDGDLDLVVSNVDDPAFIYRNTSAQSEGAPHYLRVRLVDSLRSPYSAKVLLYYGDGEQQYAELSPYRGFQSTVEEVLHFGLGKQEIIDSLRVVWPGGSEQLLTAVPVNQTLEVARQTGPGESVPGENSQPIFKPVPAEAFWGYRHQEDAYVDFRSNSLLPHMLSREGPGLAVGDVNGDGLDDLIVGGAKVQPTTIFIATSDGYEIRELTKPFPFEDMGMVLLDYDRDGDLDLYVASGGSEAVMGSYDYADRLYRNDGRGNFTLAENVLPAIMSSTSSVSAADYDRDGDLDLLVGGWVDPGNYPRPGFSYLLRNEGGRFRDVTSAVAGLRKIGLVKSALWTDVDQDGWVDLMVVGEWMSIRLFKNQGGQLTEASADYGLDQLSGWWNSIQGGDFDNDGDTDYVLGNLGLNTRYEASPEKPATVIAADLDDNGFMDPVIFCYEGDRQYPVHDRDELIGRVNSLKKEFYTYREYATAGLSDFSGLLSREKVYTQEATTFESVVLINEGGSFAVVPLPTEAQVAPVYGTLPLDLNDDAYLDLLLVGNSFASAVSEGNYDALNGLALAGRGDGTFEVMDPTGFYVPNDAKGLAALTEGDKLRVIASQNKDELKAFDFSPNRIVRLDRNENVQLRFDDGTYRRVESYLGSGYLSQSSPFTTVPEATSTITVTHEDR